MLEKIGLPAKPSLRGNNWVIDATHCQGCSSQFSILNRKHHCRRCGGLFCGSCTQQRMYLRGQGESPVRICEPCKTLEEAARFELRYGHKNKSRKGAKLASDNEDDSLSKAKGDNGNELNPSSSFSNSEMEVDLESTTPEELRQRAVEEKKKYKVLKAEGKPEEALRAFKRGKELERQAGTLEIELRKNRRKALSSTSTNEKSKGENGKKPKDDLVSELKELGWSDLDLHDTDKKPVNMTLEGELSSLIKESSHKSTKTEKGNIGIDKSEVLAIKKHALALKREGKLPEAKEELKRAKILEKQIEERELLGDDSESDDEFASLIRSMDIDKQDILASGFDRNRNVDFDLDFDHLPDNLEVTDDDINDPEMSAALQSLGWIDDVYDDMDVDDDVAVSTQIQILKKEALIKKRAGNTAEALELLKKARMLEKGEKDETGVALKPEPDHKTGRKSKLVIQRELLALKKKALALRREGKADEADQELAKGKILEQQLEELEAGPKVKPVDFSVKSVDFSTGEDGPEDVTDTDMNDPSYLSVLQNLGWQDEEPKIQLEKPKSQTVNADVAEEQKSQPKSQTVNADVAEESKSQTESNSVRERVMAHKRKALSLKREGKLAEAKEELKLAKLLENAGPTDKVSISTPGPVGPSDKVSISTPGPVGPSEKVSILTPGPMGRPDKVSISTPGPKPMEENDDSPPPVKLSSRERFKLQQESLSHKRQALKLRREGRNEEAEAEFELAKNLESRLEAANEAVKPAVTGGDDVGVEDLLDPQLLFALREVGIEGGGGGGPGGGVGLSPEKGEAVKSKVVEVEVVKGKAVVVDNSERVEIEVEIKAEKMKAVKLKRAGKQAEALEAFRRAKLLEKKLASLT